MKAVLISIQPKWCEKIFNGEKTVEVRKTRPKIDTPFKCYIYCTKINDMPLPEYVELHQVTGGRVDDWCGKVIGEFVCDRIEEFTVGSLRCDDIRKEACLSYGEVIDYFYKRDGSEDLEVKFGYGWHISDLKIYDNPKELGEFRKPDKPYHEIIERDGSLMFMDGYESGQPLTRPPQSWQYVEEI